MNAHTESRRSVRDAVEFGKVALLLGGNSSEREISLRTGAAVFEALQSRGVDVQRWDPAEQGVEGLVEAGFDRAWIALHGPGGEDGCIQGALQWLGLPYTGSGVMSSAIAMDKLRSKQIFSACDIPTPEYEVIRSRVEAKQVAEEMGFPLIFKPTREGSSVGMSKAFNMDDVSEAAITALQYSDVALVERCIVGDEITVGVLQGEALPTIRIETPRVFYDYRAKYASERTEYHCPGTSSDIAEALHADLALRAFTALGCRGWGRVDFMTGADGKPQVLEVNTVPGMTSQSLVPMAAAQKGLDFNELCWRILETSVDSAARAHEEVVNGS